MLKLQSKSTCLNVAKEAFSDAIYCQERADPKFYLQMESTKWGGQLIKVTTAASASISDDDELHLCSNLKQAVQCRAMHTIY